MAEEKETKKVSKNVEKLVDEISKLSVLELSELVTELQDVLGVTPMAVASAPAAGTAGASEVGTEAADEGGNKTVVMTNAGGNKIAVIKALRLIDPNLGLKEAKDMTEQVPAEVLKDAKPDDVKDASEKLKEAGATVELK